MGWGARSGVVPACMSLGHPLLMHPSQSWRLDHDNAAAEHRDEKARLAYDYILRGPPGEWLRQVG